MKQEKFYINRQEVGNIIEKITQNCKSIPQRKVIKGKIIFVDRYFSIKGIKRVLKSLSEGNKAVL